MSTVVRIDKSTSPLQEYRARAATLTDQDVEGWRELARWAANQGLGTQAREAYTHVTAARSRRRRGEPRRSVSSQHDGRWVTEEESYLARGFVKFEGEWMTPGERQAILAERQAERGGRCPGAGRPDAGRPGRGAEREAQEAAEAGRVLGRRSPRARRLGLLGGLRLHADPLAGATDSAGEAGKGAEMKRLAMTWTNLPALALCGVLAAACAKPAATPAPPTRRRDRRRASRGARRQRAGSRPCARSARPAR